MPALPHRPVRPRGGARGDRRATSTTSATRSPTAAAASCVATTRPETMLGDTAVAVNPEDERYQRPDRPDA
ncbi:MAG: class I tRNA ligase family protein [Desulfobacterales bacterium]|nr:class I tRNA ligase family protein [Desulfobacterales bacterium]